MEFYRTEQNHSIVQLQDFKHLKTISIISAVHMHLCAFHPNAVIPDTCTPSKQRH